MIEPIERPQEAMSSLHGMATNGKDAAQMSGTAWPPSKFGHVLHPGGDICRRRTAN